MVYTDAQLSSFLRKCRAANREKEKATSGTSEPNLKCTPKTVSTEQMEHFEQVIKQQRIEYEKEDWRGSAKWLEENFPEEVLRSETRTRAKSFWCLVGPFDCFLECKLTIVRHWSGERSYEKNNLQHCA